MNILFNLLNVGLGNNGGSSTLVKSANCLKELSHNITIIDSGKNKHTWNKLKCDHKIIKDINKIPNSDAIIATGYKSINTTEKCNKKCGLKFIWIRGWETWQMPESKIIEKIIKNKNVIKLVNSINLKEKIEKYNEKCYIIRPGNDLHIYKPLNNKLGNIDKDKIIFGGLYNLRHGEIKRMDWIFECIKELKNKYENKKIELYMFGNDKISNKSPGYDLISKYLKSPNEIDKCNFYNEIDIWLAPTSQEGLHICPQEAMLCNCAIIGTNAELSGMKDYLFHRETGLIANNNLKSFIRKCDYLIENENLRKELAVNGRNKIIELGDREKNMKLLIELIRKLKNEK